MDENWEKHPYNPSVRNISEPINVLCRATHELDHILPLWRLLPNKGIFYVVEESVSMVSRLAEARVPFQRISGENYRVGPYLVASIGCVNVLTTYDVPIILLEHGAGISYGDNNPSYPGGYGSRNKVNVFLMPGRIPRLRQEAVYPDAYYFEVGCPKLDDLRGMYMPPDGIVAISFHWDNTNYPETKSALFHFLESFPQLTKEFRIIGHAHPMWFETLKKFYTAMEIEAVRDFESVIERASVYVADNTSTLYEFASLGRPVVRLNAPCYRKEIHHGLAFWDHIPGVQCDSPENLVDVIKTAIEDPPELRALREEATRVVYSVEGNKCASLCVNFLSAWQYSS